MPNFFRRNDKSMLSLHLVLMTLHAQFKINIDSAREIELVTFRVSSVVVECSLYMEYKQA